MRCLINESAMTPGRVQYLYDTFHLYMVKSKKIGSFVELVSIPSEEINILVIIGHDLEVYHYIDKNIETIAENKIVAITCNPQKLKKLNLMGKRLLVAKSDNQLGMVNIYDGKEYGFDFNITFAELNLYNSNENNIDFRLEQIFCGIEEI